MLAARTLIETKRLRRLKILVNADRRWIDRIWIMASKQSLLHVCPNIALVYYTTTPVRLAS